MRLVRILVVDHEPEVRQALQRSLTLAGYHVCLAEDGNAALEQIVHAAPDAVLLDVGLPGKDGLETCRRVRLLGSRVAILALVARDAASDGIDGLDAGADDYMVKPLHELLMLNPRVVLSHGLIYERVWGYDFGASSNALRVYVGYLRRKLQKAGAHELIHTVRGVGYVLREP